MLAHIACCCAMRMNLEEGRTHRAPRLGHGAPRTPRSFCGRTRPGSQIALAGRTFADSEKRDLRTGRHDCLAVEQILSQQNSMISEWHLSPALRKGNVLRTWHPHDRTGQHGSAAGDNSEMLPLRYRDVPDCSSSKNNARQRYQEPFLEPSRRD